MYIEMATFIAVLIALAVQLVMVGVLFHSSYKWEQAYWNMYRLLKIERQARDIRN